MARNIIHERYGRLKFIREVEPRISKAGNKARMALWQCDCGNEKIINISNVRHGKTTSCGCVFMESVSKTKSAPINKRFGSLVVVKEVDSVLINKKNIRHVECRCDCGGISVVRLQNLVSGHTKTCGCSILRDVPDDPRQKRKIFGENRTNDSLYIRYHSMIQRCFNENSSNWKDYGGRGISVCKEWLGPNGFSEYKKHIESLDGFSIDKQIDRIDNNKNYEPGNVRPVTSSINNINKRNSLIYVIFGNRFEKAKDAAEYYDVTMDVIYNWCGLYRYKKNQRPGCFTLNKYE